MSKKIDYGPGWWLFWVGLIIIIFWIIGKILGLIQSPTIVNMLPYIGGTITIGGLGISIGKALQKINFAYDEIKRINNRQDRMATGLIKLEKDTGYIKQKLKLKI